MDDLTICKKIAEIEGVPHVIDTDCLGNKRVLLPNEYCNKNKCNFVFNPLTDDGLCFRLMFKWNINCFSGAMFKDDIPTAVYIAQSPDGDDVIGESPNKAILLAIIEANNEN